MHQGASFLDLPPPGRFRRGHAPKARFKGIAGAAWQPFGPRLLLNVGSLALAHWGISQDEIAWKAVLGRGGR